MKYFSIRLVIYSVLGFMSLPAGFAQTQPSSDTPEAMIHVENARVIGGEDMALAARLLCMPSRQTINYMIADGEASPPEEPYKVFDDLYFVGGRSVTAWAIDTSEGIVLIDAMNDEQLAQDYIVAGLEKMGLDPADIIYVIITHAHGDHYGGAEYLRDTFGARLAMSDVDWKALEDQRSGVTAAANPRWGAGPERDITLADGEKLTFGDTELTILVTPGHTLGTISLLMPVSDNGVMHQAALWGGTGQPAAGTRSDLYEASLERFSEITEGVGVDVVLSNHPLVDGTIAKLEEYKANPNGPNPFVVGVANYRRYLSILNECLLAARARPPQNFSRPPSADE